jgi:outer membrane lipoprotein SlyB
VIGAVAGGLAGSAAEEGLTRTQGVEITVREDDGSMRAYVQPCSRTKSSALASVCAS